MLHNKKRAVHNIAVYCEERYAEESVKRNHVVQIFKETDFRICGGCGRGDRQCKEYGYQRGNTGDIYTD